MIIKILKQTTLSQATSTPLAESFHKQTNLLINKNLNMIKYQLDEP